MGCVALQVQDVRGETGWLDWDGDRGKEQAVAGTVPEDDEFWSYGWMRGRHNAHTLMPSLTLAASAPLSPVLTR